MTTENAFKVILPNLNHPKKNSKIQEELVIYDCPENKILEFAKAHTQFNRKDVQDTFNLSQTTCGRILSRIINVNLKMYSFDHLRMYNIDHINTCCSRW